MNSPLLAWSLGGPEIILILCVMLLLFGAKKLPQFARSLGQASGEIKKARKEFDDELKGAAKDTE